MDAMKIHESAKAAVQGTLQQARFAAGVTIEVQREAIAVAEHILKCLELWELSVETNNEG